MWKARYEHDCCSFGSRRCIGRDADLIGRPIQKAAGHIAKKMAVATSEDGGRALCPQPFDDCENTVFEGGTPGCASDEPMEVDLV